MHNRDDEDIWRGEVTSELRHLAASVGSVQRQLCELHSMVAQAMADHQRYHEQNEHRWGLARWCQMHPFRMMAVGAALAFAVATFAAAGAAAPRITAVARMVWEMMR